MLAYNYLAFKPHGGWLVRLVKKGLFDNTVHMDARFNGKDVCAEHSLVVGYVKARLREQRGGLRHFIQICKAGFEALGVQAQGHLLPALARHLGRAGQSRQCSLPRGGRP